MLQLQNVKKIYHTKGGDVYALNGVSITFPEKGLVFINGKSGCGKTTLLNVIGGLDDIDEGEILVQDKRLSKFSSQEYDNYRNTFIGFIFQEYNLLPEFTVEQNIKIAMELQGRVANEEDFEKLLEEVEIKDLKDRKPSELSGGQRQRVAIARALVKQPRIIMADEPTGALDSATGVQVFDTLKKLSENKLVIVVSHDQEFAEKYADRIIHLVDGNVSYDETFSENEISTNLNDTGNALVVKEGAELTQAEKDTLADAIKTRKKIEFTEKLSYRERQTTGEVPFANQERIPFQKSKMKLKSAAFLGVKSLSVKPFRLAITILISAIAFAVFGVFDTLANFNVAKILENTLRTTPTSSVVATTQYVLDHENGDLHNIKISDAVISQLAQTTGGTVKGIYDLDDNTVGSISHTYSISELDVNATAKGKKYYSNTVNGFIEFNTETEINSDGTFKDFPYQLVAGYYPTINYTPTGELIPTSIFEIAISSHLADSILYYLGESTLNGQKIHTSLELIDKEITIHRQTYKITGIIDCGEIPAKYDILKETSYYNVETKSLSEDYEAFINASAQRCLFVGDGFLKAYNQIYQSENIYFSGASNWALYTQDSSRRKTCYNYFYNVNEFTKDNILLFDEGKYNEDGSVRLAKDEIIIDCGNLKTLLSTQISLLSSNDRLQIQSLIEEMRTGTNEINRYNLNAISNLLNIDFKTNECTNVTITKISSETGNAISNPVKIVGVYFNVDPLKYAYGTTFNLMINEEFMETYQIYNKQGDYSKILFSAAALQTGAKEITNLMLSEKDLALTWYKNTVLSVIQNNEKTIEQVADLLLYVAIALVIFSVFMLFNYISTSISGKRKSVGVLRGLGASGKDVLITFLIESLIIAFINGILANIFAVFGCSFVNSYVMNTMNIFVAFALFGTRQLIFILGVSICTALISSAFPIIKIAKKKPVALIR